MNERQMQFRVGLVVFATMMIGGLLASLNAPLPISWLHSKYQIGIEVAQAPGVDANTPVRKNGILIGRVKSIEDKEVGVLLKAEIDGNRPLFADYEPHIRTTVLGDATIDFISRRPMPGSQPVADGAIFKGRVDPNPFDALGQLGDLKEEFSAASRSLTGAGDEVAKLAKRVNEAFGEENGQTQGRVTRLMDTTERAMNQFAQTMTSVNDIIGDPTVDVRQPSPNGQQPPLGQPPAGQPPANGEQMRLKLRQGLDELPDAIHEFRVTMRDSRGVLQSAEKNFKNLEAFTEPLGQKGDKIAEAILKAVAGLDQLIVDLNSLTHALNDQNGTIGKLIHDGRVYENLSQLMENANVVLNDIHTFVGNLSFQLQPVLHDARVFMDKVATEPGRIVTGGLSPSNVK